MAASNATAYPVLDTAYRVYFNIKSLTTASPITGGLTGLACQLMKDGAQFVNSTNAPAEVNGSGATGSGYGYVDLTAAEMNFSAIVVRVTASNSNAIEWQQTLLTSGVTQAQSGLATTSALTTAETAIIAATTSAETSIIAAVPTLSNIWGQADYGDAAGRATTVLGQIAQIWRAFFNAGKSDTNAQTMTLFRDDSVTTLMSGGITVNSTVDTRAKFS